MLYSPSKNAFYVPNKKAAYQASGSWPDDTVEISDEEWNTYGASKPPVGKQRGPDSEGRPAWVDATPYEPSDEEWRSTAKVSARQGMEQLIRTGLDEQVDAKIYEIEDPLQRKLTRNWLEKADVWERNNAQFIELGEALGLTPEQMDEHIKAAAKL